MKNRFIVVYTVFAAFIFIFSLSFFGFNLYREFSTNLEKSETKISRLTNDIRTISYNQNDNNEKYAKSIKDAIGDPSSFAFIQVKRSGETVVLYPAGKLKEETVSRLTKTFETRLTVNEKPVEVFFNIYLIKPDSIFYFARISFLLILIITLITIIMIIYLNMSEASSDVISLTEDDEDIEETDEEESVIEDDTEVASEAEVEASVPAETPIEEKPAAPETVETAPVTETTVPETPKAEEPAAVETPAPAAEAAPAEEPATATESAPTAEVTPEEVKAILSEPLTDAQLEEKTEAKLPIEEVQPAKASETDPAGLFNPETGIGWESYLLTRLNNEIDRATASEIDLALFVIKLENINKKSESFKNVCNYLGIQFQFKDLIFEYKEDYIVAIKISMGVDEAIPLADKLHGDICNIINATNCRIGISSRSIRMVSGERLLLEAIQAIEHSDAKSPVIAFRVDSEKYRQMMEKNQG